MGLPVADRNVGATKKYAGVFYDGNLTGTYAHVNLPSMLKALIQGIGELLYPPNCLLCHQYLNSPPKIRPLCFDCLNTLEFNRPPFCQKCSRHLPDSPQPTCDDCLRKDFFFDCAFSPCFYNETMRKLIHLFKYGNKTSLRHCFTDVILSFLKDYSLPGNAFDLLMPIPLHPVRFRERGYNQSGLLAQGLAPRLDLPVCSQNLIRVRHTQNQARVSPKNRFTNIHGAFKIKYPAQVKEKSILLVDDLLTSGTTVSEAARVLKKAGARRVGVLTLALAP